MISHRLYVVMIISVLKNTFIVVCNFKKFILISSFYYVFHLAVVITGKHLLSSFGFYNIDKTY